MIDFTLTKEQKMLKDSARDFAEKEIRPVVEEINNMDKGSRLPWELSKGMFKKATELGFTKLLIPEEYGGFGMGCIELVLVMEEIGAVDVAIAADYFNLTATVPTMIMVGGNEEQKKRLLAELGEDDGNLLCGAQSEPNVAGSELFCPFPNPELGMKTYAKREKDGYVINGTKSGFVTNAGVAKSYFILARTDLSKPAFESTSIFYIPAGTKGLSVGKQTEMIGYKASHHAEVYLDNVLVPEENRIGPEGGAMAIMGQLPQMPIGLAACYVGLARAAYDYGLKYAKERESWGQPIIQHQAVALKVADMAVNVQAARLLTWDAAVAADNKNPQAGTIKAPAAKTYAVDAAIKNAENAVKIMGAYGVAKEYPTGRYLNDAWIGYACDFTKDILRLGMAHFL